MNQTAHSPLASGPLAERASGIVVPAHLANAPEEPAANAIDRKRADGALDADGRRRLVISKETRKKFTALSRDLGRDDLAMIVVCKRTKQTPRLVEDVKSGEKVAVMVQEEIPGACGEVMFREDEDGGDPGFGCKCTRIHFLAGGQPGRLV